MKRQIFQDAVTETRDYTKPIKALFPGQAVWCEGFVDREPAIVFGINGIMAWAGNPHRVYSLELGRDGCRYWRSNVCYLRKVWERGLGKNPGVTNSFKKAKKNLELEGVTCHEFTVKRAAYGRVENIS